MDPTSSTPKAKVFVFVQEEDAPHPIRTGLRCLKGRALTEEGEELAELYALDEDSLKKQAEDVAMPPGRSMVFVENPWNHPQLSKILAREGEEDEEPEEPTKDITADDGYLDLVRSEHNLCATCISRPVCQITNQPMYDAQKVTVTGCAAYYRKPEDDDE